MKRIEYVEKVGLKNIGQKSINPRRANKSNAADKRT